VNQMTDKKRVGSKCHPIKLLLVFVLLLSFTSIISAEEFGYNYLDGDLNVATATNYTTVSVNDSTYWDGHEWDDSRWLDIDGGNANQDVDIGTNDFYAGDGFFDFINFSYLVSNFGGGIDATRDPWFLSGTSLEINENLTVNGNSYLSDTFPRTTLTYSLGSGVLRWLNLYVQNINAEEIDAFNLHLSGNATIDGNVSSTYFIGNGSLLTGVVTTNEDYWTSDGDNITNNNAGNVTIDGKLNVIGQVELGTDDAESHLYFKRESYNYITANTDGSFAFITDGKPILISNAGFILNKNDDVLIRRGNLGIGLDDPDYLAHLYSATPEIKLESSATYDTIPEAKISTFFKYRSSGSKASMTGITFAKENAINGNTGGVIKFIKKPAGATATEGMRMTSKGYFGINEDDPQAFLDVNGNSIIKGDLYVGEDLNVTGNFTGNQIYGEMWYHNHTATVLNFVSADTWYPIFFSSDGNVNGFTYTGGFLTESNLTAQVEGLYQATYMASGSGKDNHNYFSTVLVNGVERPECSSHKTMSAGGDITTMNGNCFISLSIGDDVQVATMDYDGTGDGNYYGGNLNLLRIGN